MKVRGHDTRTRNSIRLPFTLMSLSYSEYVRHIDTPDFFILETDSESLQSMPRQFAVVIDKQDITHGREASQNIIHRVVALRGQTGSGSPEISQRKRPRHALRHLPGPLVVAGIPDHADKIPKGRSLQTGKRILCYLRTSILRSDDHGHGHVRHFIASSIPKDSPFRCPLQSTVPMDPQGLQHTNTGTNPLPRCKAAAQSHRREGRSIYELEGFRIERTPQYITVRDRLTESKETAILSPVLRGG